MASPEFDWPKKTQEFCNHHFDSTIWNHFRFRDDDIVIATYAKSGTTWVQQIVAQLLFNGRADLDVAQMSPWLDLRFPSKEIKLANLEAQSHRRFLKTHLPVDALVVSPNAKYVYIGRDGRDVVWSLYNHHLTANAEWYKALNDTPGLVGRRMAPPRTPVAEYYREWLERDGHPFWPFWKSVESWWAIRHLPNVRVVHFENLKNDLPGQIRSLASFLDLPIDESRWEMILLHSSFDYMKKHATKTVPLGGAFWDGGSQTFIHKGTNGRWRQVLTPEESAVYERTAVESVGTECARWLATGKFTRALAVDRFSATSASVLEELRTDPGNRYAASGPT